MLKKQLEAYHYSKQVLKVFPVVYDVLCWHCGEKLHLTSFNLQEYFQYKISEYFI